SQDTTGCSVCVSVLAWWEGIWRSRVRCTRERSCVSLSHTPRTTAVCHIAPRRRGRLPKNCLRRHEVSEEQLPIRVVVVDDHLVVREGLRMMLEVAGKGRFTLVGDAADGATALRLVEETQPDVVLMD